MKMSIKDLPFLIEKNFIFSNMFFSSLNFTKKIKYALVKLSKWISRKHGKKIGKTYRIVLILEKYSLPRYIINLLLEEGYCLWEFSP